MRGTIILLLTLATLALVGTGCSGVRGNLVETGVADTDAESVLESLKPTGSTTPEDGNISLGEPGDISSAEPFAFTAPELFSGSNVSGTELYEDAPMIVSFVSPTCPICLTEGPEIARAADQHPEITYLVIHSGADTDSYREFADAVGLYQENVIHVEDESGVLAGRFNAVSIPSTLLVDLDGRVEQSTGALELQGHREAASIVLGLAN